MALPVLVSDPACLAHEAPGHPESPARLRGIEAGIAASPRLSQCPRTGAVPVGVEILESVHSPAHVASILAAGREAHGPRTGGWIDPDTWLGPGSLAAALASAGSAMAAVEVALSAPGATGFSLGRPPGHHATAGRAMGFCLFNNVAIAAQHARMQGLDRVAILDFDVHHGNGTQDIFYSRPDVLYLSCHQSPLYPGTGARQERGRGDGEGFTVNAPMPAGSGREAYEEVFAEVFEPAVRAFGPKLLLLSAGFDAHIDDPLANMALTSTDFGSLAHRISGLAAETCSGRTAWVLEGGYGLPGLRDSVVAVLEALA